MTPEQQRIAIAEWCGFQKVREHWEFGNTCYWLNDSIHHLQLPDYLNDLNAIVGVLRDKVCGDADLERAFIKHLNAILDRRADDDAGPVVCEYEMAQITTPADELCEALLRTIGKWENSEIKGGQP